MKRAISLAGLAAGFLGFGCPFCLLALTGLTAGVGSLMPVVPWVYWGLIGGLGILFMWFLIRSWRSHTIPGWIVVLGGLGLGGLIFQAIGGTREAIGMVPAVLLSTASLLSFARTRKGKPSCCTRETRNTTGCEKGEKAMATKKRTVEVFTAGCPVCEPVVELVNKMACPSCDVVIYDLNAGCDTNECRDKAKEYGVTRIPAVAVNGTLLDCCKTGTISERELRAAGIGSA